MMNEQFIYEELVKILKLGSLVSLQIQTKKRPMLRNLQKE